MQDFGSLNQKAESTMMLLVTAEDLLYADLGINENGFVPN